jgi:hypothetical protein
MNPTKAQKIKSLKIAKNRIKSGIEIYICFALKGTRAENYLRKYIDKSLSGCAGYATWLNKYHIPYLEQTPMLRKQGRLQWIDWMIENAT